MNEKQELSVHLAEYRAAIESLKSAQWPGSTFQNAIVVLEEKVKAIEIAIQDQALELVCFVDPGHCWLRVPVAEIDRLAIETSLSGFSYRDDKHYYLEGNVDLNVFINARFNEDREVSGWDDVEVQCFPHEPGITQLRVYRETVTA